MKRTSITLSIVMFFALSVHALSDKLSEGSGVGDLKLGMSEAEAIKVAGTPHKSWIVWNEKHIDCLIIDGKMVEIRINPGSDAKFSNGIGIASTPEEIKKAFGEPEIETQHGIQVWRYEEKGVVFWFKKEILNQIVITKQKIQTNQRMDPTSTNAQSVVPEG